MAETLGTPLLIVGALSAALALAAGLKAQWHDTQLKKGGDAGLGFAEQLRRIREALRHGH